MTLPLNGYLALALIAAVPLSPVWLPLLPLVIRWWRRETARGRAQGYATLPAFAAEAIAAYAEAAFVTAPTGGWTQVARNVDRYLAAVDSPRHWRTYGVLTVLAFAPWLRLQPRLARLPLPRRRSFLERNLRTTRGFLLVPSLARQLLRMGYYHDRSIAAAIGFRAVSERRLGSRLPSAPAAAGAQVAG